MTAATRLLFSVTASSTVCATVCTPTVKVKRSGVTVERPVPLTLTVSGRSRSGMAARLCETRPWRGDERDEWREIFSCNLLVC